MGRHKRIEDVELLAKAREIFLRDGVNVSTRKIAAEIGISNSVLFQRFGTKIELFFAATTPPAPDVTALLASSVEEVFSPAHLEQIALALLDYFRTLVPVMLLLSSHPSFEYEAFRQRHADSPMEKLVSDLMAAMEEQRRRGAIDCADVGPVVLNLVAVAHSLAMFEQIGVHHGHFDEPLVRELARTLWRGIAPHSVAGSST